MIARITQSELIAYLAGCVWALPAFVFGFRQGIASTRKAYNRALRLEIKA